MALCAYVLFSGLDTSAKYLVELGFAAPFIAWARFATHTVLVLVIFRSWASTQMFRVGSWPQQLLRAVFLFGSTILNFFSLQTLQLAEVVSIMFFAPMVITALSGPLLGEWAGWRRWLAVLIGLVGVVIITRPGFGTFVIGHLYILCAMACYSSYVIMTRKLGATETAESLIFYPAIAAVVLMLPAVPVYGQMPQGALQWFVICSLGFYGGVGHYLLIRSYKLAAASALAPFAYTQMVWVVALGFIVFGELPDLWTVAGAAVIVASGLYIVHREHRLRLKSRSAPNTEADELAKKL